MNRINWKKLKDGYTKLRVFEVYGSDWKSSDNSGVLSEVSPKLIIENTSECSVLSNGVFCKSYRLLCF
jgi:hypothetical protein